MANLKAQAKIWQQIAEKSRNRIWEEHMTDRELLELAAKSADLHGTWVEGFGYRVDSDEPYFWNPLTDDGEALKLAVQLGIDLEWRHDGRVSACRYVATDWHCFTAFESSRENRLASARRAIVRVAADISRIRE